MAYGVRYYVQQHANVNRNNAVYRVELLEDGFGGSPTKAVASLPFFRMAFDGANEKDLFSNPIQKGRLELDLKIRDVDQKQLLDDIVAGNETTYQLRLIIDGDVQWTGFVVPDLISYPESPLPFTATITAKDLSILGASDYENSATINYKRYIKAIAEILNSSGLGLDTYSYHDWTADGISDDYLFDAYVDVFQLQDFGQYSEGTYGQIDNLKALAALVPNGFILRQWDNRWNLIDLSSVAKNGGVVPRYKYNSDGEPVVSTPAFDMNTVIDRQSSFLLRTSENKPYPAVKKALLAFNHKTSIQNILFEDEYVITENAPQFFGEESLKVSKGDTRIVELSGSVEVDLESAPSGFIDGEAEILIQVADEELDLASGSWDPNNGVATVSVGGSGQTLTGSFRRISVPIPNNIDEDELTVSLRWGTVSGASVTEVRWSSLSASITNGGKVSNGATKDYELIQDSGYSLTSDTGTTVFGQGPNGVSKSAIRYFSSGAQYLQVTNFAHEGEDGADYERFLLNNALNMQRSVNRSIDVDLWAFYNPLQTIEYQGSRYLLLNGQLSGYDTKWTGDIIQLKWETAPDDTFKAKFKIQGGDAGSAIPPSSGTPSDGVTDHGQLNGLADDDHPQYLTEGRGDARYPRLDADNKWTGANTFTQPTTFEDAINLPNASPIQSAGNNALEFDAMGNVTVPGNLEILGQTLSANVENLDVDDPIIKLADGNLTDALDIGFIGQRSSENVGLIWDESADEFAAVLTDSDATTGNVHVTGYADLRAADTLLKSLILEEGVTIDDVLGYLRSQTFLGGFGGSGTELEPNAQNDWTFTVDNLVVRRLARFYELVVERVRANGGTIIVSPGAEKVTETEQVGAAFDWNQTDNPWAPGATNSEGQYYAWTDQYENFIEEDKLITIATGDLLRRQEYNGRGTGVTEGGVISVEGGSPTPEVNDPRRSFTMWITADSQAPSAGHEFAVIGNSSDPSRQNGIIITASDSGNPYRRIYSGVDRLSKFGSMDTVKGQDGRLDNIVTSNFSDLDGSQQNLFGAYWDGNFYVNDGFFRGTIEVTGGNAETKDGATGKANQAYEDAKDYTDSKVSSQAGNAIIRSNSEPNSRPDGSSLTLGDLWINTANNDKPFTWDGNEWKPAYTVIQGNQISTPNLSTITTKTGVLTVDEKITIGDGSNDGIIESFNYDSSNGFRLQEADGKAILNNADIRGSFTAAGDVTMGGAFSYDESSGVVKLGGNSSEGGVRLEINGYTSLPGGGYLNTDGLIFSSDKHIGFGAPGTSGLNIDAGMYPSGNDLHLSAFGSTFAGDDKDQAIVFDHKRVDDPQLEFYNNNGAQTLTIKSSFVVITNAPSGTSIGAIRNFPNETPEPGAVVDVLNSTTSTITILDASGVSGGNIGGQGGADRELFPDTFLRLRYYASRWHLSTEFG